jgi:hypothetical protein
MRSVIVRKSASTVLRGWSENLAIMLLFFEYNLQVISITVENITNDINKNKNSIDVFLYIKSLCSNSIIFYFSNYVVDVLYYIICYSIYIFGNLYK